MPSTDQTEALERFYREPVYRDLQSEIDQLLGSADCRREWSDKRRAELRIMQDKLRAEYLYPTGRYGIGFRKSDGTIDLMLSCPRFEVRRDALNWIADQGVFGGKLGVVDVEPPASRTITGAAA